MWSKVLLALLILQLHHVTNSPVRSRRSPREFQQQVLISSVPVYQNFYTNFPFYIHQQLGYKDVLPIITRNYSHPLFPFLLPIQTIVSTGNRLIPLRDLSVIPLSKDRADDEAPTNQYRNFYGGYGTGLFFGGHGAGHGFYAYG